MATPGSPRDVAYEFGPFRLEPATRRLLRGAETLDLRPKAFDLLVLLIAHRDRALGKDEMMSRLWPDTAVEEGNLSQCVFLLRKALGQQPGGEEFIATVSRHGYRFVAPVAEDLTGIAWVDAAPETGLGAPDHTPPHPETGVFETVGARNGGVHAARVMVRRDAAVWTALCVAVLALAGWAVVRRPPPAASAPRAAVSLRLAGAPPVDIGVPGPVAVSPDGRLVAVVARSTDGRDQSLWLRALDDETARRLEGTVGARSPFWSPEGAWLGFFADGKLKRISVKGGPPETICDAPDGYGGTWNRRGVILFAAVGRPLQRVSATGGQPAPITTLSADERPRWPVFLPDGDQFVYGVGASPDAELRVGRLSGGAGRRLLAADKKAAFAAGHVLFNRISLGNAVRAQRYDPATAALIGDPVTLAVAPQLDASQAAIFSVADSGALVYLKGSLEDSELRWFDREGNDLGQVGRAASYFSPRLSPDGRYVAVDATTFDEYGGDIWILPATPGPTEGATRLTHDRGNESYPIWSPDGSRVVFLAGAMGGPLDLYEAPMNGLGHRQEVFRSPVSKFPSDWSSHGDRIVFMIDNATAAQRRSLWVLSAADRQARPFSTPPFNQWDARLSPDGRWVAYTADPAGQPEVYVQDFPDGRTRIQVSSGGGEMPVWRRDGRELFYHVSAGHRFIAVPFTGGDVAQLGTAEPLFQMKRGMRTGNTQYDVSPDGRFLVNVLRNDPGELTLMLNWIP